jgi:uncharacterized protein (DUF2147 family)
VKTSTIVAVTTALTLLPLAGGPLTPFAPREARAEERRLSADAILGEWWTENRDGRIRFVKHDDGTYRGVVTWGAEPRKDQLNKDPKLRARPIVGMVLIWHLVYDDEGYEQGSIYNPEDGETYRVKAWLTSQGSLKLRGYLGISLLGRTQTWTRYR